jgi:hypothetical protein
VIVMAAIVVITMLCRWMCTGCLRRIPRLSQDDVAADLRVDALATGEPDFDLRAR